MPTIGRGVGSLLQAKRRNMQFRNTMFISPGWGGSGAGCRPLICHAKAPEPVTPFPDDQFFICMCAFVE